MRPSVQVEGSAERLASSVRDLVAQLAHEGVRQRGHFTIALSGGSTPRRFHTLLAMTKGLPWDAMHFFFGDERHVPPDNANSNFKMAEETLFSRAPIPAANIHRVHAENPDAGQAAAAYEADLSAFFKVQPGEFPRFDVNLLGLGPDGHTASLFPHTSVLEEKSKWMAAPFVEKANAYRITMTAPVINASRAVVFMVQGADKADAVQEVLEGKRAPEEIPARLIRPEPGGLWWFLDPEAAARLSVATRGRTPGR